MKMNWPKLSETLPHQRHPGKCQSCGGAASALWIEHDDNDHATTTNVALCRGCSARIIEPHPRLYSEAPPNKPFAGALAICAECRFRKGLDCQHPKAKRNGGPGVTITIKQPLRAFVDGTRNGKRTGWLAEVWPEPAKTCEEKDILL